MRQASTSGRAVRTATSLRGLLVSVTLLVGTLAQAQAQLPAPVAEPDTGPSLGWMLLRTLVVLGLVVGLIYLTLNWGLRKLMGVKGMPGVGSGVVKLVERIPLDPKRSLFVIQVSDEYLLLGAGEGAVNLIAKIDREAMEKMRAERASKAPALSPFLQKLLARRGGGSPPTGA